MKKALYLECYSGISGDMTVAALLDLGADQEKLERALKSLPMDGFRTEITRVTKSGLDACDFNVILDKDNHDHDMEYLHGHSHDGHHHGSSHAPGYEPEEKGSHHEHRGLPEIRKILMASGMTDRARETAVRIFEILAKAEAKAHGVPRDQVHFHEVGAVDSIVDIAAVAACLDDLDVDDVIVSELCDGKGFIRCQHGVIPVPVPAVVNIVQQNHLTLKITEVEGELVTPTGAAVAAALRTKERLPGKFTVDGVGLGAGKRQYSCPGILRAMLISYEEEAAGSALGDRIWKLETNVDDCTGEELGHVMKMLFAAGARDVYYTPIYMKKNRPAYELNVICSEAERKLLEEIIFRETTTIGIRKIPMERTILPREMRELTVEGLLAKVKLCTLPDGSRRCYPEYDSAETLAKKKKISYREAWQKIRDLGDKER